MLDEGNVSGTSQDYSDTSHRVYFEFFDPDGLPSVVLKEWLGAKRFAAAARLSYGFEIDMPIQEVPDLIRRLAKANVAVYQVVRRPSER